jgi:hypothetical protein
MSGIDPKRAIYEWKNSAPVRGTHRAVLGALAEFADVKGETFRGQAAIAERCAFHEVTVRRALKALEGQGLIKREKRYDKQGRRTSDTIRLCINSLPSAALGSEVTTERSATHYRALCTSLPSAALPESTEESTEDSNKLSRAREGLNTIGDRIPELLEALGITDETKSPGLLTISEPVRWVEGGCDVDLDIIPALRSIAARGKLVRTWAYCSNAVFEERDRRLTPAPAPQSRPQQSLNRGRPGYVEAARNVKEMMRNAGRPGYAEAARNLIERMEAKSKPRRIGDMFIDDAKRMGLVDDFGSRQGGRRGPNNPGTRALFRLQDAGAFDEPEDVPFGVMSEINPGRRMGPSEAAANLLAKWDGEGEDVPSDSHEIDGTLAPHQAVVTAGAALRADRHEPPYLPARNCFLITPTCYSWEEWIEFVEVYSGPESLAHTLSRGSLEAKYKRPAELKDARMRRNEPLVPYAEQTEAQREAEALKRRGNAA